MSSVQSSHSVMSDSLWPYGLQYVGPSCLSPVLGIDSNSCPLSLWTTKHSHPLLLLPSVFPNIRVFLNESAPHIKWPKYWSLVPTSVLPMNIQNWFPLGRTGWISLQSKGLSKVSSNTTVQKHQFFSPQFFYSPILTSIHDHWKNHSLD